MVRRPLSIPLVGWSYLALGVLMILLGIIVLVALQAIDMAPLLEGSSPSEGRWLESAIRNLAPISWTTIAFGVGICFVSVAFLRQRGWSRPAVEVITWLTVIYNIWFGILVWRLLERWAPELGPVLGSEAVFRTAGVLSAFCFIILFNIPLLLVIQSLRSREVRSLFTRDEPENPPGETV